MHTMFDQQSTKAQHQAGQTGEQAELALKIRGLAKRFGYFTALSGIDLDIEKGEFVCFLGPSGCGKTTLLRAIAGLDPQNEGTILQNGRDISHLPVSLRDFGIVFQSYALFPNLSVERNVGYGLRKMGLSPQERKSRIDELLDLVNLPNQSLKYPAQLSGGQQQRVALARALAPSPGLLLLDEPLSALDAQVRIHLRDQLKELQRQLGVTTIMVTHDQEEAMALADRIVVMNNGVIEQVGTPREVFTKPVSPFAAGFLGDMNFIPAELQVNQPDDGNYSGLITPEGQQEATKISMKREGLEPLGADAPLQNGTKISLCIRPADITLSKTTASLSEKNPAMAATIKTASFRGNYYRLAVDCPQMGQVLDVEIAQNHWHELDIKLGDSILVTLPANKIRVFVHKISRL